MAKFLFAIGLGLLSLQAAQASHPHLYRHAAPHGSSATAPADNAGAGGHASYNWAGYAASGGTYTGVSGTWTVPAVSGGDIGSDATWVGIGGVHSRDLIQAGTQAINDGSGVAYQAWYELLPDVMQVTPLQVAPGDHVAASITQASPGMWRIAINDSTSGKNFSQDFPYDSSGSSAEWVEERPSFDTGGFMPLDNFGSVSFSSAMALKDGSWQSAQTAGARPLSMVDEMGEPLAESSDFGADGSSFSVSQPPALSQIPAQAGGPQVIYVPFGPFGIITILL